MIRNTTLADLKAVMGIYERAIRFMQESGNPNQWVAGYPSRELIAGDIEKGVSYVMETEGQLDAVFSYTEVEDATYRIIEQGAWKTRGPYGTVHRLASAGKCKGVATACFDWCAREAKEHGCVSLRADTHEDNKIMQHLLSQNRYVYCGVIHLENGAPRLAFERSW